MIVQFFLTHSEHCLLRFGPNCRAERPFFHFSFENKLLFSSKGLPRRCSSASRASKRSQSGATLLTDVGSNPERDHLFPYYAAA